MTGVDITIDDVTAWAMQQAIDAPQKQVTARNDWRHDVPVWTERETWEVGETALPRRTCRAV
jgi:hypothetical protein